MAKRLSSVGLRAAWALVGAGCVLACPWWGPASPPRATGIVREVATPVPTAVRASGVDAGVPSRAIPSHEAAACKRALAEGGVSTASPSVTYVVRAEVDRLLEQLAGPMRCNRGKSPIFGPVDASGPDDPTRRIGLRTGDLLLTVNGYEFSTWEQALTAYAHLRRADDFWVVFLRNGRVQSLLIRLC